jgi:hypothetical protein
LSIASGLEVLLKAIDLVKELGIDPLARSSADNSEIIKAIDL